MKIIVGQVTGYEPELVPTRCPHCGNQATLDSIGMHDAVIDGQYRVGHRVCPNPECRGHVFVVIMGNQIVTAYPPIRIDFNKENIPSDILESFEEAVSCHATSCFIASALMVRRTLEVLCADRKAPGNNLKEKIQSLGGKIVIPKELLEAMDELRLLGNDAAHVNAQTFSKISGEELEIAIEFTKEILKAVYQYSGLLEKLRALKQTVPPP